MTQTTTRTRLPRRGALALVLSVAGAAAFGVSRMKRARPSPAAELLLRDRPVAVGCFRVLRCNMRAPCAHAVQVLIHYRFGCGRTPR